ncbi:amino acid permease-domain-containing protein, partial [Aspergillus spectabilis]
TLEDLDSIILSQFSAEGAESDDNDEVYEVLPKVSANEALEALYKLRLFEEQQADGNQQLLKELLHHERVLVGVASFCNWFLIYLAHIRFRQGLQAQKIDNKSLPFRDRFAPYSQYLGMVLILFFRGAQLYFAIFPSSGEPSAENFFATYITLPLFLLDYVGYKFWFKTKIVKPREMDSTPAGYFDRIDEEEREEERLNPVPRKTLPGRIWGLRTAII